MTDISLYERAPGDVHISERLRIEANGMATNETLLDIEWPKVEVGFHCDEMQDGGLLQIRLSVAHAHDGSVTYPHDSNRVFHATLDANLDWPAVRRIVDYLEFALRAREGML